MQFVAAAELSGRLLQAGFLYVLEDVGTYSFLFDIAPEKKNEIKLNHVLKCIAAINTLTEGFFLSMERRKIMNGAQTSIKSLLNN